MTLNIPKWLANVPSSARVAALYAATLLGANAAFADPDWAAIEAQRVGEMKGLAFHGEAQDVSERTFFAPDGSDASFEDLAGRVTLLNFWATWCGPCRAEMPTLDALQAEMGSDDFAVALLASGPRNEPEKIEKFFGSIDVANLTSYRDPKGNIARDMAILGLPITIVLDPNGKEIARYRGDADWNSEEAQAILKAIVDAYAENPS